MKQFEDREISPEDRVFLYETINGECGALVAESKNEAIDLLSQKYPYENKNKIRLIDPLELYITTGRSDYYLLELFQESLVSRHDFLLTKDILLIAQSDLLEALRIYYHDLAKDEKLKDLADRLVKVLRDFNYDPYNCFSN